MKSLNEVIKKFELCNSYSYDMCNNSCPYFDDKCACDPDALYYLLEYREMKEHLACLDDSEIRGDDTQIVNNPPLTWDELKDMEGKPIWLESHGNITEFTGWAIINEILSDRIYFILSQHDDGFISTEIAVPNFTINKEWNVYRKERKNETD